MCPKTERTTGTNAQIAFAIYVKQNYNYILYISAMHVSMYKRIENLIDLIG